MKKYFMKVIDLLKEYFNSANRIVFWLTGLSIAWIIGYKFLLIDINPLFSNADKIADIIYTICTSVVASGLFYLFTIYIPNCAKINRMKSKIKLYIKEIDSNSIYIINSLIADPDKHYTIENLEEEKYINMVHHHFMNYSLKVNDIDFFIGMFKLQKAPLESIQINYSNRLRDDIILSIIEFNISYRDLIQSIENGKMDKQHYNYSFYLFFEEICNISKKLKDITK